MKILKIQPLKVVVGSDAEATLLGLAIHSDNLTDTAKISYSFFEEMTIPSNEGQPERVVRKLIYQGLITIGGILYANWPGDNTFAIDYALAKLNGVVLVEDSTTTTTTIEDSTTTTTTVEESTTSTTTIEESSTTTTTNG